MCVCVYIGWEWRRGTSVRIGGLLIAKRTNKEWELKLAYIWIFDMIILNIFINSNCNTGITIWLDLSLLSVFYWKNTPKYFHVVTEEFQFIDCFIIDFFFCQVKIVWNKLLEYWTECILIDLKFLLHGLGTDWRGDICMCWSYLLLPVWFGGR